MLVSAFIDDQPLLSGLGFLFTALARFHPGHVGRLVSRSSGRFACIVALTIAPRCSAQNKGTFYDAEE